MLKRDKVSTNNYLIKQLPKATAFINNSMKIEFVSDKWIADFDFINNDVLGKPYTKLFKKNNENWKKLISNCIKNCSSKTSIEPFIDGSGNRKWFEVVNTAWYDENENIIGTIIQSKDVSQTVFNERKLEKLKILSEQMAEVANIGLWDYNLEYNQMSWSSKTKAIYEVADDYEPNFVDTTNFFKNGISRNTISMAINKAITNESPFREKLILVTEKKNEIWVIISGQPLYQDDKFIGLAGTIQNVNELKLAEIKRRENEDLLRTLIDSLPLNVYIKDLESRKILVNKAEAEHCGAKTIDEVIGKDDFDIYDEETAALARKSDLSVMRDLNSILSEEMEVIEKNGPTRTFLISKIPLIDSDGHAYGLVGFSMDISDLKRKEQELHDLINVTSSQNDRLLNFAHIVSHNLRSHSANFSMLLNFLRKEDSPTEKDRITEMLFDSSNKLMETLDNLNEMVDINTKKDLPTKAIYLKEKIKGIEKSLSADLISNNVKIINNISDKIRIKVIPAYIDSILNNFLTNAIHYKSPDRDPIIKLEAYKEDNYTILSIEDNGLGIDLKKYGKKLFGMYKTFHNKDGARGVGLFISKHQIEAMNGKVTVTSKVGSGTTFKIYFNEKI